MTVPAALAGLLHGRPAVGAREQAFVFLTVDQAGFPYAALLSRAELAVSPDRREVLAAAGGVAARPPPAAPATMSSVMRRCVLILSRRSGT